MSRLYKSRSLAGPTAVDTKSQLVALGSETAPGPLLVPGQATRLVQIIAAAAANNAAANDSIHFIRVEGPGLPEGPETFTVGASGGAVATGQQDSFPAVIIDCDIPVTPANEVLLFGEMGGEDIGALQTGVTLVFETAEIRRS